MLRAPASNVILDTIIADQTIRTEALVDGTTLINIEGYTPFLDSDVRECYVACPVACVPNVQTVTVTVPESCECPYEWHLTITPNQCPGKYEVQSTFVIPQVYTFNALDGAAPLPAAVATEIARQINAHEFAKVRATANGANIVITEKDCQSLLGTCGFKLAPSSGTVVNTTPGTPAIMPAYQMMQAFPIQWGAVGGNPKLARCAGHCVLYLHIRGNSDIQDIDMNRTYGDFDREVFIYFPATVRAVLETELGTLIPCVLE